MAIDDPTEQLIVFDGIGQPAATTGVSLIHIQSLSLFLVQPAASVCLLHLQESKEKNDRKICPDIGEHLSSFLPRLPTKG